MVSRTGRTSTKEPGRNARTEPISTVKPPLTLDEIKPVTISSFSCSCSRARQLSSRLAFSRDRTVCPMPLSTFSTTTSTLSPTATSSSPFSSKNSLRSITPSDFRPVSTVISFSSMATILPEITAPISTLISLALLCSNNSAKDKVIMLS